MALHSTRSLDYGIMLQGELTLTQEDGSKTVLKQGDIVVQRATPHAWRNNSKTEWARIVFVLIGEEVSA
jgi:quercetin dioxygenase-like cupin family protein